LYQPRTARSTKRVVAAIGIALLTLLQGCRRADGKADVAAFQSVDPDVFRTLPLPAIGDWPDPVPPTAPQTIVSMIPSVTELLFTIGLGDRVVGRDDWSDWPPEAQTRPSLGNQQTSSVERIADVRPDLVVFWKHLPDKSRQLSELFRLRIVTPGTENRSEVFDGIVEVAAACAVPERGRQLVAFLGKGLEGVRERWRARPRPRVLLVLDRGQAFFVPGKASFVQELFDICNLENVAAGLSAGNWPAVSLEQVLDWDPDVVLDLSLGAAATPAQVVEAHAYWRQHATLAAVKRGRVVVLNAGVLVRPGPRLVAVAEELARIVHGAP
jgi:iron complex transport system substrate-binding protein